MARRFSRGGNHLKISDFLHTACTLCILQYRIQTFGLQHVALPTSVLFTNSQIVFLTLNREIAKRAKIFGRLTQRTYVIIKNKKGKL